MNKVKIYLSLLGLGITIGVVVVVILIFVEGAKPTKVTIAGVEFEIPSMTPLSSTRFTLQETEPKTTEPLSIAPNTPTSIFELETPSPVKSKPPAQFIQEYYAGINNRQYDKTWLMLSNNYRAERNPEGIQDYVNWWNSFTRVDVLNIVVEEQTTYGATITVTLFYTRSDGSTKTDSSTLSLILDPVTASWLIDK